VELSVVVLTLGILIGIASVTFLLSQQRSHDTSAKSRVSEAMKAQKVIYSDKLRYDDDIDELEDVEPALDYTTDAIVAGKVYVKVDGEVVTLAAQSATNTCFWTRDASGLTMYASGDCDPPLEDLTSATAGSPKVGAGPLGVLPRSLEVGGTGN
jgi:Tfp pilus assembly protein PilE